MNTKCLCVPIGPLFREHSKQCGGDKDPATLRTRGVALHTPLDTHKHSYRLMQPRVLACAPYETGLMQTLPADGWTAQHVHSGGPEPAGHQYLRLLARGPPSASPAHTCCWAVFSEQSSSKCFVPSKQKNIVSSFFYLSSDPQTARCKQLKAWLVPSISSHISAAPIFNLQLQLFC